MKIHREQSYETPAVTQLSEALAVLQTPAEVLQFLLDLCTPTELQALADRWIVVEPLMQELPYRQIHETTRVSVTTIGRVARCLNFGSGGYSLAYKRVKNHADKAE